MSSRVHLCPCPAYIRPKSEELRVWWMTQLNEGLFSSWLGWAKSRFKMYSLGLPSARAGCAAPSCWSQLRNWLEAKAPSVAEPSPPCAGGAGDQLSQSLDAQRRAAQAPCSSYWPSRKAQGIWDQQRLEIWGPRDSKTWKSICLLRVIPTYLALKRSETEQTYHGSIPNTLQELFMVMVLLYTWSGLMG